MNNYESAPRSTSETRPAVPVGQSLSLFDDCAVAAPMLQPAGRPHNQVIQAQVPAGGMRVDDPHMRAAWRLAKALKGRGRGARHIKRLNPQQRHQIGGVICDHLLASLRQQVAAEQEQRHH